jgi:hypothetical protein
MFSKFHFTRIFQRVTGVSPGRFLSALRLEQAKRLLVSTSLNVADISMLVGYNSVGTFSSRFTRSVGLSPTTYRRLGGFTPRLPTGTAPDTDTPPAGPGAGPGAGADPARVGRGVVSGHIWSRPASRPSPVFVGLFPSRIPEGRPARCAILDAPGPYLLDRVPEGVWYLLSQSMPAEPDQPEGPAPATEPTVCVATHGPIQVHGDTVITTADLRLNPIRTLDPPALLALLDVHIDDHTHDPHHQPIMIDAVGAS